MDLVGRTLRYLDGLTPVRSYDPDVPVAAPVAREGNTRAVGAERRVYIR